MKYKKFNNSNRKYKLFISLLVVSSLLGFGLYESYAQYRREKTVDIIGGVVTHSDICRYEAGHVWNFQYTGSEQDFIVPCDGDYKIELWGASGNNNFNSYVSSNPSYAGYVSGDISLVEDSNLYVYVGGTKQTFNACLVQGNYAGSGGATDIRLVNGSWNSFDSLKSRIMVAGGAGGSYSDNTAPGGGAAGGLESYPSTHAAHPVYASGQTYSGTSGRNGEIGTFGVGGNTLITAYNCGAGGYYGGSGGPAGGGGSSFISGHNGCNAISSSSTASNIVHTSQPNHYSGYVFTNTKMVDGKGYNWTNVKGSYVGQIQPDGSVKTGHDGNGYARITLIKVKELDSGTTWNFDYTGNEQVFKVKQSGLYKLEVWGAQGGSCSTGVGGTGGYSSGLIDLKRSTNLYINVGGVGANSTGVGSGGVGGYNGGAYGYSNSTCQGSGGGGGATHIAGMTGVLSSLKNNVNNIYIVAGGGGASSYHCGDSTYTYYTTGGHAGGYLGNSDTNTSGGGQSINPNYSNFGVGYVDGGGGYYGGIGTTGYSSGRSAGGGSGYIGNPLLTNKVMYCYNCAESNDISIKTVSTTCSSSTPTARCAKNGNGYARITFITSETPTVGDYWNFDYTGGEQNFVIPVSGTYKLETWGAQGGSVTYNGSSYIGGYGGYSVGSLSFDVGTNVYVNVGGSGSSGNGDTNSTLSLPGGYNGGGSVSTLKNTANRFISSGGGATHVATSSGVLSSLSNNRSSILIVSGGGGGGYKHTEASDKYEGNGGSGGGYIGVNGEARAKNTSYYGLGGTQTAAGCAYNASGEGCGSFGLGGNVGSGAHGSSGGGGYYGGGGSAGYSGSANSSGAGGSGYIGNSLLTDKAMYCYNCQISNDVATKTISNTCHNANPTANCSKEGKGFARITLVSVSN